MHDGHAPRRFPWLRLAFGGISLLVLIGSFGGFMWLLRTYVDPPRVAAAPSAAALLASVSNTTSSDTSEPRVIMASRDDAQTFSSSQSGSALPPLGSAPGERYERAPPPPNSGAPIPSWAGSPLPGAPRTFGVAASPPPPPEAGTVSFDGPVPLPRSKPRVAMRVQLPAAAPLPRSRPPSTVSD